MDAIKRYFRSPAAVVGLLLLLVVIVMAITASWIYPRDPLALAGRPLIWPFSNPRFLLGTDNSGRDIAAQIFYGARISLLIGGVATVIAVVIGVLIGAFAGYYGGWVDTVLDAHHRGVPDPAEFRAAAGAGRRVRLDHHHRHHRRRHRVMAGTGAADARGIPVAAQPRIRPGRTHAGHEGHSADPRRDPAQCAAAGHRLCQRGDGAVDPAGKRAGLPAAVRSQCGVMGQPHRPRPRRAARAVVCLGDPRHRHPAHRARGVAGRPGPQ